MSDSPTGAQPRSHPDPPETITSAAVTPPLRKHVFDERLAAKMQRMYTSADVVRRRELVYDALQPQPRQTVLDLGCGPGFSVAELSDLVGPTGSVVGVDTSPQMLTAAQRRCTHLSNVRFHQADVSALPVPDASIDAAICVQVLEYIPDPSTALAELARVLRPGGRVVIWDVDWSTISWHSKHPDRMSRVLDAFDDHVAHPALPRTLAPRLQAAGFTGILIDGHCFTTTALDQDSYVGAVIWPVLEAFVPGRRGLSPANARDWAAEQQHLHAQGEFFFSSTQFRAIATR